MITGSQKRNKANADADSTVRFIEAGVRRGQQDSKKSSELLGERILTNNRKQTRPSISKESDQALPERKQFWEKKKCQILDKYVPHDMAKDTVIAAHIWKAETRGKFLDEFCSFFLTLISLIIMIYTDKER